jgi:beta-phosphoglucomutase-like phosphatase (HAD superfamily)
MTAMPTPRRFDAVLFDLDGVLTATAALHAACWKETFDPLLADWSRRTGRPQEPFEIARDYRAHVDGREIERLRFRGKPAPDGFLEAARRLRVAPERAVVVEDAFAGVAAGRAGDFGLVIGVARNGDGDRAALRAAGADVVVGDLAELLP